MMTRHFAQNRVWFVSAWRTCHSEVGVNHSNSNGFFNPLSVKDASFVKMPAPEIALIASCGDALIRIADDNALRGVTGGVAVDILTTPRMSNAV